MNTKKKKQLKDFGLIWSGVFLIVAILPYIKHSSNHNWAFIVSFAMLLTAYFKPSILQKFYTLWMFLGESLGNITSKIILFILYFGLFTPISLILKLFKIDLLNKKIDNKKNSYWIDREEQPQSMKYQF